jgi:hypothetical protein
MKNAKNLFHRKMSICSYVTSLKHKNFSIIMKNEWLSFAALYWKLLTRWRTYNICEFFLNSFLQS